MSYIDFKFCLEVVEVRGGIHSSMEDRFLREDMLELDTNTGETISIWGDVEQKKYLIEVFKDSPENDLKRTTANDCVHLKTILNWLVRQYSIPVGYHVVSSAAQEPNGDDDIQTIGWHDQSTHPCTLV